MRWPSANTEPSREASMISRRFQKIRTVGRYILKSPLVAKRTCFMQRISQLAITSAKNKWQIFITYVTLSNCVTRLRTYLILILLFSLSSSEEISWSDAEHQESSLLADCVDVLDLLVSKEGWRAFPLTVSILPGPTSSHDLHLERGSSGSVPIKKREY